VQDGVWCELVKLHTINKKKPTKELVGRKGKTAQEKGEEHHSKTISTLGDPFSAWEDNLVVIGDEAIRSGLVQILLRKDRRYPAGRGVPWSSCVSALGASRASAICARGLRRRSKESRDCNNGGGGRSKELVNSEFPHSPLI
jgi:hypothetical protein